MDSNDNDIEQFLLDVREHFRASLETSEYENTSNMFHVTAADATERLLQRCEFLLQRCLSKKQFYNELPATAAPIPAHSPKKSMPKELSEPQLNHRQQEESVSYMDMSANCKKAAIVPMDYNELNTSTDSDKTFRCSTQLGSKKHDDNPTNVCTSTDKMQLQHDSAEHGAADDCQQIYDVCQVTHLELPTDETQMVANAEMELIQSPDCPYKDLPAGHLAKQQSSKYGQLQRIEKRLFFDQSKKCYCGIIEDWLLVYVDGPSACSPTITLYLKTPGIEIEHFGEGKRRDICFQITTADPNKKFVFQANNEVDAKEWIHAVEAAIRGDTVIAGTTPAALATIKKSTRKLPTPPVIKKINFLGNGSVQHSLSIGNAHANSNDCIYEEPSPLYEMQDQLSALPDKFNSPAALARKYDYDVPKCPAQPLRQLRDHSSETDNETAGLLHAQQQSTQQQPVIELTAPVTNSIGASLSEKSNDFQAKIKDVHSKLSSQLTAGPLKKVTKKGYTNTPTQDTEPPIIASPPTTPSKEQKKQKKSSTAITTPTSPQKFTQLANSPPQQQQQQEKSSKNWFLNRLNKSTSSMRNSTNSNHGTTTTFTTSPISKSKQSEKENLLNSLDFTDGFDTTHAGEFSNNSGSNPTSPTLKCGGKSKVNMIINQLEASGHLATMFSVETLASNALATFSAAFCESDCNNYEPIMTVSPPPSSFLKKV